MKNSSYSFLKSIKEMPTNEFIDKLAQDNILAKAFVKWMIDSKCEYKIFNLVVLYQNGILGNNIVKLFKLCEYDYSIFDRCVELLRKGYLTKKDVLNNLKLNNPVPFIDNYETIDGLPINYIRNDKTFTNYAKKQKASFNRNYKTQYMIESISNISPVKKICNELDNIKMR